MKKCIQTVTLAPLQTECKIINKGLFFQSFILLKHCRSQTKPQKASFKINRLLKASHYATQKTPSPFALIFLHSNLLRRKNDRRGKICCILFLPFETSSYANASPGLLSDCVKSQTVFIFLHKCLHGRQGRLHPTLYLKIRIP